MSLRHAAGSISIGRARIWTGVLGLAVTAGYMLMTSGLPFGSPSQPGAAVFPAVISLVMLAASLTTIWDGRKILREDDEAAEIPGREALFKIAALLGALLFYAVTLRYLGRIIGTYVVAAAVIAIFMEKRSAVWPLIHAAWITFGIWLLFIYSFGLPLPRGVLINL